MHHPSFVCGVGHLDRIILRRPAAFEAVVARHRQVARIICGHHHRPITTNVAQAIASVGPGAAHIVELELGGDNPGQWTLEPPAFQVHLWVDGAGIVSHTALVDRYPGPYPFVSDTA